MHDAPIAAVLFLVAGSACNPDLGKPFEVVIIQDAGARDGDADGNAGPALAASGAACTKNGECQSNVCFVGNKASYCSFNCTATNALSACATAPFDGKCNQQGFCRLP